MVAVLLLFLGLFFWSSGALAIADEEKEEIEHESPEELEQEQQEVIKLEEDDLKKEDASHYMSRG